MTPGQETAGLVYDNYFSMNINHKKLFSVSFAFTVDTKLFS